MALNWWAWLPTWAQRLLAAIPSPVVEAASGVFTFAFGWACAWLCWRSEWWIGGAEVPLHSFAGATVSLFFAHVLSAAYEALMDPNGWEWADLIQREVGIFLAAAAWWWVL
jgi:hypothetical protein